MITALSPNIVDAKVPNVQKSVSFYLNEASDLMSPFW